MSHTGHTQARIETWPLFIAATLLVSILFSLSSCMTADPQRNDSYDDYDRKVAIAPVEVTKTAVTPEGHYVVLVRFAHIFAKSQPDPNVDRYVARTYENRLFVYNSQNWQSKSLENHFEYEHHDWEFDYSGSGEFFDYDTEMHPVLQTLEKITPVVLVYRNGQWQKIWRGETQARSPKPCPTQGWFLDGNHFFGFCDTYGSPLSKLQISDSRGQIRILDPDTLQTRIALKRVHGDTLDFISYSMNTNPNTLDTLRYTWNRIIRKAGHSFADSSNLLKKWPIPRTIQPRQLLSPPNSEFYTAVENSHIDFRLNIHVIDVRNDSVVMSSSPHTVPEFFTTYHITKSCIRNCRLPVIPWERLSNSANEDPNGTTSGIGLDTLTFAFHSTCGDAPDTLRLSHSADTPYRGSHLHGNEEGKVWALHRLDPKSHFQPPSDQEDFLSHLQNAPSDSLETYLRREFVHRLTHWNGQAWQDLPWPF